MIHRTVSLPELALIAGTRVALGAGIGMLLADRLNADQRKAAGWALFAVGALTTIPLAAGIFFGHERSDQLRRDRPEHASRSLRELETIAPAI